MKYGIFSDIHGNLEALEAVLEFFKKAGVEEYLCVGDIVGYGADPRECIAKVRTLPCVCVGGNHDWACVGLMSTETFNPAAREAVLWTRRVLSPEEVHFLKSLKSVYTSGDITLVHGSLDFPEEFQYITDLQSARETLKRLKTKLCFVGHSHLPMILSIDPQGEIKSHEGLQVTLEEGRRYLVNVGSVGQPRDGDPRAAFALFDSDGPTVAIKRLPYDIRSTQKKILEAGLPPVLAARLSGGW